MVITAEAEHGTAELAAAFAAKLRTALPTAADATSYLVGIGVSLRVTAVPIARTRGVAGSLCTISPDTVCCRSHCKKATFQS